MEDHSEVHEIATISGTTIGLKNPLSHKHYGDADTYTWLHTDDSSAVPGSTNNPRTIRLAAEVGLLTRNIVFKGADTEQG